MDENSFTYEIIMINDGSEDKSWEVVQTLSNENLIDKSIAKENIDTIRNTITFIGFINDKYKVDVLWSDDVTEQPTEWLPFAINIEDEGIHFFHDIPYLENKF